MHVLCCCGGCLQVKSCGNMVYLQFVVWSDERNTNCLVIDVVRLALDAELRLGGLGFESLLHVRFGFVCVEGGARVHSNAEGRVLGIRERQGGGRWGGRRIRGLEGVWASVELEPECLGRCFVMMGCVVRGFVVGVCGLRAGACQCSSHVSQPMPGCCSQRSEPSCER